MARGIFVSYRRDDVAHVAGRLADGLATRFGRDRVFVDVDSVAPGEDFVARIDQAIADSHTFLAIIGPNWLKATTDKGERRIDLPGDFIRLEVLSALKSGVRIIPVLIDGTKMPRAEDLPEDLAQLVRHNAVEVDHTTFARDLDGLIGQLTPPKLMDRLTTPRALAGGAALAALAALLLTIAPFGRPALPSVTTTLALADQSADERASQMSMRLIRHRSERDADGTLRILPDFPYRERMEREGLIDGIRFESQVFSRELPRLVLQVTNTSEETLFVNELHFEVIKAAPDLTPIPVLRENARDFRIIRLRNEGWGALVNGQLTVTAIGPTQEDYTKAARLWRGDVMSQEYCADPPWLIEFEPQTLSLSGTDGTDPYFDLEPILPQSFDPEERYFCAYGKLTYQNEAGEARTLDYRTRVSNFNPLAAALSPAIGYYDLRLDPDRQGYTAIIPAQREIAPQSTDTIEIDVLIPKSARFELRHAVRLSDGRLVKGEQFSLETAVPGRSHQVYNLNPERRREISPDRIAEVGLDNLVIRASYDPLGYEEQLVEISQELEREACYQFADAELSRLFESVEASGDAIMVRGPDQIFLCSLALADPL